jgi:hypothetical protein
MTPEQRIAAGELLRAIALALETGAAEVHAFAYLLLARVHSLATEPLAAVRAAQDRDLAPWLATYEEHERSERAPAKPFLVPRKEGKP